MQFIGGRLTVEKIGDFYALCIKNVNSHQSRRVVAKKLNCYHTNWWIWKRLRFQLFGGHKQMPFCYDTIQRNHLDIAYALTAVCVCNSHRIVADRTDWNTPRYCACTPLISDTGWHTKLYRLPCTEGGIARNETAWCRVTQRDCFATNTGATTGICDGYAICAGTVHGYAPHIFTRCPLVTVTRARYSAKCSRLTCAYCVAVITRDGARNVCRPCNYSATNTGATTGIGDGYAIRSCLIEWNTARIFTCTPLITVTRARSRSFASVRIMSRPGPLPWAPVKSCSTLWKCRKTLCYPMRRGWRAICSALEYLFEKYSLKLFQQFTLGNISNIILVNWTCFMLSR